MNTSSSGISRFIVRTVKQRDRSKRTRSLEKLILWKNRISPFYNIILKKTKALPIAELSSSASFIFLALGIISYNA